MNELVKPNTTVAITPEKAVQKEASFNNFFEGITELLKTAGTLKLTDKQKEILFADVQDEDVEIRYDGLIYLPWMEYVTRLRAAFGCGWAIIPNGNPNIRDNLLIWGFYLIIEGKLMGYAIGEQTYYPNNRTMSFTDACEGAKSNALMRLCKGIGISLELWKPAFVRRWKEKFATTYTRKKKDSEQLETVWKRKDAQVFEEVHEEEEKTKTVKVKIGGGNTTPQSTQNTAVEPQATQTVPVVSKPAGTVETPKTAQINPAEVDSALLENKELPLTTEPEEVNPVKLGIPRITEKQWKLMLVEGAKRGLSFDDVKNKFFIFGVTHHKDIKVEDFDKVFADIKKLSEVK